MYIEVLFYILFIYHILNHILRNREYLALQFDHFRRWERTIKRANAVKLSRISIS